MATSESLRLASDDLRKFALKSSIPTPKIQRLERTHLKIRQGLNQRVIPICFSMIFMDQCKENIPNEHRIIDEYTLCGSIIVVRSNDNFRGMLRERVVVIDHDQWCFRDGTDQRAIDELNGKIFARKVRSLRSRTDSSGFERVIFPWIHSR